ncbi:chalcone isomerase family protein [Massilia sp. PWRC2]|uniref:chalcone isomerase family protein n=1 Tax=Massilia sp. PWRC2 TaxID=2804626 RepID=UPI003CEB2C69
MKARRALTTWLMALACMVGMPALAAPLQVPAQIPAQVQAAVPQARLAGSGQFTYFGIKVYTAELFVGPKGYAADAPFALDLRYARHLKGRKIAEASADQMEKIGAGTAAQRQGWLQKMLALFPDVAEGSHITGISVPGQGAKFYLDGVAIGAIDEPEFARAFFGIWLDPASTAPALRQALLRQAAPQ